MSVIAYLVSISFCFHSSHDCCLTICVCHHTIRHLSVCYVQALVTTGAASSPFLLHHWHCRVWLSSDCIHCYAAEQRFANPPNENRLAELESLRDFLKETLSLLDKRTQEMAAPAERLKALLMSKDKKATILEMAGMHDPSHLDLLHAACLTRGVLLE